MSGLLRRLSLPRRPSKAGEALVKGILDDFTVTDVVRPQLEEKGLAQALGTEDVLSVCARLGEHQVSSMPIFDAQQPTRCIGIVDFSDAVALLLQLDWGKLGDLKDGSNVWEELSSVPVQEAMDLSTRNPMVTISQNASLLEATKLLSTKKLRRALVTDAKDPDRVVAVLSPSAVVQFVTRQLRGRDDPLMMQTIGDLKVGCGPVVSVTKKQPLLQALHQMYESRHSVVAVIDPHTKALAGSISMSDIKAVFHAKRFSILVNSCWQYIVGAREASDSEVFPFFGVSETDKLQMVVSKLLATNVHHLYVVNKQQSPVKVVSFSDVCTAFLQGEASSSSS